MAEKYPGPYGERPEGAIPQRVDDPQLSDRVLLARQLPDVKNEVSQEFDMADSLEEQEAFLKKKMLVCSELHQLLERFNRSDVNKQLNKERTALKRLRGRQARVGMVERPLLLACYEDLNNLLEIFSPLRFSKNIQVLEFMDRVIDGIPVLAQEVNELIARVRPLTDPAMVSGIIEQPQLNTDTPASGAVLGKPPSVITAVDQERAVFEDNMPTVEFEIPETKPQPRPSQSWWKRSSIHALAVAAGLAAGSPESTRQAIDGVIRKPQQHSELRLPQERDKQSSEVAPAYEKFRELGAAMEANSLRLSAPRLDRSLYWVFLEAGKDQNITHRAWKDNAEVEDQSRWAAKWAAQLLENGRVNKKFIKQGTINADAIRAISSYEGGVLTIRDTAGFYERLVKPLLDFKRD